MHRVSLTLQLVRPSGSWAYSAFTNIISDRGRLLPRFLRRRTHQRGWYICRFAHLRRLRRAVERLPQVEGPAGARLLEPLLVHQGVRGPQRHHGAFRMLGFLDFF